MCVAIIGWKAHPDFPFLLLHNRDEYFDRAALPLARWPEHPDWMGGRDRRAGGMWLAFTEAGRYGLVTNYRDPALAVTNRESRGLLLPRFFESSLSPRAFLDQIAQEADRYNPFNLIVGERSELPFCLHSLDHSITPLVKGLNGISNRRLETPWPKVQRMKEKTAVAIATFHEREALEGALFSILADDQRADESALPSTGVPREVEIALSSIFVKLPGYGTVSSLVALKDRSGALFLSEKTFGPAGELGRNAIPPPK